MLTITIPGEQIWDPVREEFGYTDSTVLTLEHNLLSLAKWESKWHIPFFSNSGTLTREQQLDYLRCMTVGGPVDPAVYRKLTQENWNAIQRYMNDPMTATWFRGEPKPNETGKAPIRRTRPRSGRSGMETTAEVLYAQMIQLGVPKECEEWHLNRLLTLLRVCQEMAMPPRKVGRAEAMTQQRMLNAQRKAKYGTRG